ncbi:MAG: hypothetical protein JSU81_07885 [Candidatus Coatesbacteria bacterium]|nr:MAG: hypothetical protein JSU81_07885 [Candidatus Coatesbacteria bacterium]
MKTVRIFLGALALGALAVSCGEEGPTAPEVGAWTFYDSPYEGALTHCAVQRDGTFWATVQLEASRRTAIVSYDGEAWSKQEFEPSVTEALEALLMFDDGSGWAGGSNGALLEHREGEWKLHRPFNNLHYYYLGAASPDRVWAIGQGPVYPRGYEPVILYYEGGQWREADKPAGYASFGPVVVTSGGGYLVGRNDTGDKVLRLSGTTWGSPLTFDRALRFFDVAACGGYAFAVGEERPSATERGAVYQLAPGGVRDITPGTPSPDDYSYRAAYVTPEGHLWVAAAPYASGGQNYKILYWDGEAWTEAAVVNDTGTATRAFDLGFCGGGGGWAVGGEIYGRNPAR